MDELTSYSILYPQLPVEIVLFFKMEFNEIGLVSKQVAGFCEYYRTKYSTIDLPQPRVVAQMCDMLVTRGKLSVRERGGMDGALNKYISVHEEDRLELDAGLQKWVNSMLGYVIYGFKLIYEDYKKYVLPVEHTNSDDKPALGTCFLYRQGIATAKHCIENAKKISIRGIQPEMLKNAKYELHQNPHMDLVFIRFETPLEENILVPGSAEILDEVMTLGYPKIAGFHNFLTAENATVSSRFTTSVGQVVSSAEDIWMREKLFLITAKIQGGNSGGPVVKKDGSILGVAVNLPEGEGDYDNLGYGTVIPIVFLDEIINGQDKRYLNTHRIEFVQIPLNGKKYEPFISLKLDQRKKIASTLIWPEVHPSLKCLERGF